MDDWKNEPGVAESRAVIGEVTKALERGDRPIVIDSEAWTKISPAGFAKVMQFVKETLFHFEATQAALTIHPGTGLDEWDKKYMPQI